MEGSLSVPARHIVLTKLTGFDELPSVGTAQTGESTSISPTTMNHANTNKSFGGERTKVMGDPNDAHFLIFATTSGLGRGGLAFRNPLPERSNRGRPINRWNPDGPVVSGFRISRSCIYECLATEIEISGCAGLVPIASVKGPQNELLLDRFQTDALGR
jgi:hypothetical protein